MPLGMRMARRGQWGSHVMLVGKQLPPTAFDFSLFDNVRLGAYQNLAHGFRCVLQELSVCGASTENRASGMGRVAAQEGAIDMRRTLANLLNVAHPAKEHQDEGDRNGRTESQLSGFKCMKTQQATKNAQCWNSNHRTNSTGKRGQKKSLSAFS